MAKKKASEPVQTKSEPVVVNGLVKIKTTDKNKWNPLGTVQDVTPEVAKILIEKGFAALCQ